MMVNPEPIHSLSPEEWLLAELDRVAPTWSLHEVGEGVEAAWRSGLKAALKKALGLNNISAAQRDVKLLDRRNVRGATVEKVLYNSEDGVTVPALLILPHVSELPQPAVVVCHDRGPGKASAILSPGEASEGPDRSLVRRLLDEGLIVLIPDATCFGERYGLELPQVTVGAWLGRPLLGRWVHDVICGIDVLTERQEVESSRLAVVGIGVGGATALYAMALDERFRVGAASGQLMGFRGRVRALCNRSWSDLADELYAMVPGVLRLAELYDIAALCAPQPLLMLHTADEPLASVEAARACARSIREGYARLGGKGLFEASFLPEMGSRAHEEIREFLMRHLRAQYV